MIETTQNWQAEALVIVRRESLALPGVMVMLYVDALTGEPDVRAAQKPADYSITVQYTGRPLAMARDGIVLMQRKEA